MGLDKRRDPATLDALVVFGCRVANGQPSPALQRRLQRTEAAAAELPKARLVLSGGDTHGAVEAEVMRDWLVARGIEETRIVCEPRARSTAENAVLVVPILIGLGARRVGLVTDRYHMRRSLVLLHRALRRAGHGSLEIVPLPAAECKSVLRRAGLWLEETVKLGLALWRGPPTSSV